MSSVFLPTSLKFIYKKIMRKISRSINSRELRTNLGHKDI